MSRAASTLVIGLGNELRGDDGVGRVVARRLRELELSDVEICEASGEGTALMEAWKDAAAVILIDAAQSGAAPGTIHRLDASRVLFHYSTHAFSLAEAVELARALDQLPPRVILYGIEGRDFGAGVRLSPEVAAAGDELVSRLQRDLQVISVGHGT